MRIALLVYGRLNKCKEHYNNIMDNIGKEHDIDVFLSSDNSVETQLQEFIELYKPISYNNDKIIYNTNLEKYEKPEATNIDSMIRHFINKKRVFALLELYVTKESITYDIVISLRIDLVFHNSFNLTPLQNDTIYIPSDNDFLDGINDQVAYGSIDVMKKYMNIYEYIIDLLERKTTIAHPESLTLANIQFHKINIIRVKLLHVIDR
jgi:hypothetical protein